MPHALVIVFLSVGALGVAVGIANGASGLVGAPTGRLRALALTRGLRFVLVGFSLIGVGAGSALGLPWLVGFATLVGIEELLETTTAATILESGEATFSRRVSAPGRRFHFPTSLQEIR